MSSIVIRLPATVDGTPQTIVWRYDTHVPWSVRLILRVGSATVIRFIGRDLIRDGMDKPTGTQGVKIEAGTHIVRFRLLTGTRRIVAVEFPRPNIEQALRSSYLMVPAGKETTRFDWNNQIATLIDDMDGAA